MFKKLLPKEERYFDDFKEMINYLLEMGHITNDFFCSNKIDNNIFLKLKPIEKRCDEISSRVIKRLNNTFITPFDREDIFSLTKKLDSIGDILLGASVRVDTFNITEKIEFADKMTSIILLQIKELGFAIQNLKDKSGLDHCKAVNDLETEGDNIFRTALKKLFAEEKDPLSILKKKEILEILENACDKCQSTANVILSIYIKNS